MWPPCEKLRIDEFEDFWAIEIHPILIYVMIERNQTEEYKTSY